MEHPRRPPHRSVGLPGTRQPLSVPRLAVAIVVIVVYVGLEWVTFIHVHKGVPVTPWNPGLGVILGFMLLVGPAAGVLLFAGTIFTELLLQTELEWLDVLAIGLITSASYAGISLLVRRALHFDVGFNHLRDVLLLLVVGFAGALTSAALLITWLVTWGPLDPEDVSQAALPLLVGDMIGIAIVTPLMLRFVFERPVLPSPRLLTLVPELFFYGCLILSALMMVGATGAAGYTWFYLLFVPVVAAALRRGLDGACISLTATQFGLVHILHLHAYDARVFTQFQILMLVLTATGLIVGAVVNERRHADALAREAEARLKQKQAEATLAARFNLVSGMASALAHEITQPMTAARALARSVQHILQQPDADLARVQANVATLVAQIDHAGGILRHARDFLRRGKPHLSTINVRKMLDEAMILIRPQANTRRIALDLEVADGLPALHGDQVQLEQVLLNLVRNGMDAIGDDRDGRIRIAVRRLDSPPRIEFSVVDNGPGVPADMTDRVFNPLITTKHDGLGLGLSICESIIKSHQGRIWLQSSEPARTEFRFSLPIPPSAES